MDSRFQASPVAVVFGRYWRKPPLVEGRAPIGVLSGRSEPAVFAQAVVPDGLSQVVFQSTTALFAWEDLTVPMPAAVR